jgi:hypothetical protein
VVLDNVGSPVNGSTVTFSAPSSGPSGIFEDSLTNSTTAQTDAVGIATAAVLRANGITGSYLVDATVSGVVNPAQFQLNNMAWYVSMAGSDVNDCLSPISSCASINGALSKGGFTPEDTVLIGSGTYTGSGDEVVYLGKSVILLGGWNSGFTSQTGLTTIDGQDSRRGISVTARTICELDHFAIINGHSNDSGGGVYNEGSLKLLESTVSSNSSDVSGGGILNSSGELTIVNSTISENEAFGSGGGINNLGNVHVINSTIYGNRTSTGAGGITNANHSLLTLANTTIFDNTSNLNSGGISNYQYGVAYLQNTILAGNLGSRGPNCRGSFSSLGYNLIETDLGCTVVPTVGDIVGSDPLLGYPVGQPAHIPISASSPAVDAGNPEGCEDYFGNTILADQRGMARVANCDIGSYEYTSSGSPSAVSMSSGTSQSIPPTHMFREPLRVIVVDGNGSPIEDETVTFTAPSSGASGIFEDSGTYTTTAPTDEFGLATAAPFEANDSRGSYTVNATVAGLGSPAQFELTNAVWYVSSGQSDTNDCLSPATSCASIIGAISKTGFVPGDTILVSEGVYTHSGIEVVLMDKSAFLIGGWDADFITQDGSSIIDAQSARRGMTVMRGADVYMERFTLQNGYSTSDVGGISNKGVITLNEVVIQKNMGRYKNESISNAWTGVIYLNNSAIINNGNLDSCTANVMNRGLFIAKNSTLSDNKSGSRFCPVIENDGEIFLNNTTISHNSGIGIEQLTDRNDVVIRNTLIANNGFDCRGPYGIISQGYNLVGIAGCDIVSAPGDMIGTPESPVNANVRRVADNGGPTPSNALISFSPAIDAGNPNAPGIGEYACEVDDQRGVARPIDGDGDEAARCDIGAYEFDPTDPPTPQAWIVDPHAGVDSYDCLTPITACHTIEGALRKSDFDVGDLVKIKAGTFERTHDYGVSLDKSVVLKGGWDSSFSTQKGKTTITPSRGGFYIAPGVGVVIDHINIRGAREYGVLNEGKLQMVDCSVTDGLSIGIKNEGDLVLDTCTVSNNRRGIVSQGNLTVNNSTVNLNYSISKSGGGITVRGKASILNSTISDNIAGSCVGVKNYGSLQLNNATITENFTIRGYGGGICNLGGLTVENSLIALNQAPDNPDCLGPIISNGYNLIGDDTGCSFTPSTGDIVGTTESPVDPLISSLNDNGGTTLTIGLLPDSPSIDAGNPDGESCEATDQRGIGRPIDGNKDGTSVCDIGAYELDPASPPAPPRPFSGFRMTYSSDNNPGLPGKFLCSYHKPDCSDGEDLHGDSAHAFAGDTYDFFFDHHKRDSIDDAGMPIISTVHYRSNYGNAFWSPAKQQVVYGDKYGFPLADDVVGHELTHGITEHSSNLFYYYQSGAINESFSDMWGELVDQTNDAGDDRGRVKWLIGEDVTGFGAIRDMENPPAFDHPDKMTSPKYYTGSADSGWYGDYGGVHINSGVNNKAAYLITDGGEFNGYKVAGLGIHKVATIYYEVQTNLLTSGADYKDLYNALYQACLHVIGGADGITYPDCVEVRKATDAVEMNQDPHAKYNPEAEVCPEGKFPTDLFYSDFEDGEGKWVFKAVEGTSAWKFTTGYATSGAGLLWGDDYFESSDSYAMMKPYVSIPTGSRSYLHFNHAFGFEYPDYDGGWLEFKMSDSSTWVDAAILIEEGLDYNGTINKIVGNGDNKHTGRKAFVGDSHGYVSSRYNLRSLAGKSVRFRWRMSTDSVYYDWGWFLDDVRIYTCGTGPSLAYVDHIIDDDNVGNSSGNGDGKVDCDETIELTVDLLNKGTKKATGVSAELSSNDEYITPTPFKVSSAYPNILINETRQNETSWVFTVDPSTPYGYIIPFDLDVTARNGGPWSEPFGIFVTCGSAQVPNDDFDDALEILSLPYSNAQNTRKATTAFDDPMLSCVGSQKYNTVWYKYTATENGIMTVDTFGSGYDTILGVWTGNRGSLKPVAGGCKDDSGGQQSKVSFGVAAGTTFYIEVASHTSRVSGLLEISASFKSNPKVLIKNASFESDSNKDGIPNNWKGKRPHKLC